MAADALSRNRLSVFHLQIPAANEHPTPIPPALVEMLVIKNLTGGRLSGEGYLTLLYKGAGQFNTTNV